MSKEELRQEFDLRMRKITVQALVDKGLLLDPARMDWNIVEAKGRQAVQCALTLATMEHEIEGYYFPSDWWQAFKERWFPKWLKKKCPVKKTELLAEHKFPELDPPTLGKEFVHLKVR